MEPPIEIRDPSINTDAIVSRLQDRMRERYGKRPPELPDFELPALPRVQDATLRYHLERAHATHDQVWVQMAVFPSPATQLPILGRLWRLVREQAHRLILYYLEMAISKQIGFNRHVVGITSRLAAAQEETAQLREEIADLRQQLREIQD
jgi:hypothetical protein